MTVVRLRLLAPLVALALLLPGTAAAAVGAGSFTPNRSAKGIKLGMTRAQVVARLGQPLYENANGYMEYSSKHLFDVYLDRSLTPARVRLIGLSGPDFCIAGTGICIYERGTVGRLKARYGAALSLERIETGERTYFLHGAYKGCPVFTEFTPFKIRNSSWVTQVFIGYESGGYGCPVPFAARLGLALRW